MAVDLGKKEKELLELFEKLGVPNLEEQIGIMEEMEKNQQNVGQQEKTEMVENEMEI